MVITCLVEKEPVEKLVHLVVVRDARHRKITQSSRLASLAETRWIWRRILRRPDDRIDAIALRSGRRMQLVLVMSNRKICRAGEEPVEGHRRIPYARPSRGMAPYGAPTNTAP